MQTMQIAGMLPIYNGTANKEVIWWIDYSDVLENNILPKRLKLDNDGKQMTWSQMIMRNSAHWLEMLPI